MKVLVACERSGIIRDAFIAKGHDAISCDLAPTEKPGPHIQDDVRNHLNMGWDLMIAHPDCTFLCSSGLHHNNYSQERRIKSELALDFVRLLMDAPILRICIENPVGRIGTNIRPCDQIIQPYEYGHNASKRTCLWLKNLPHLRPTKYVPPRWANGLPRWDNQTDAGHNDLGPSPYRTMLRARTYQG
jgi:hypothetical protein